MTDYEMAISVLTFSIVNNRDTYKRMLKETPEVFGEKKEYVECVIREEERLERTAKMMIEDGIPFENIAKYTYLRDDEIRDIAEKMSGDGKGSFERDADGMIDECEVPKKSFEIEDKIAKKMIKKGMSYEDIMYYTDLGICDILDLAKEVESGDFV